MSAPPAAITLVPKPSVASTYCTSLNPSARSSSSARYCGVTQIEGSWTSRMRVVSGGGAALMGIGRGPRHPIVAASVKPPRNARRVHGTAGKVRMRGPPFTQSDVIEDTGVDHASALWGHERMAEQRTPHTSEASASKARATLRWSHSPSPWTVRPPSASSLLAMPRRESPYTFQGLIHSSASLNRCIAPLPEGSSRWSAPARLMVGTLPWQVSPSGVSGSRSPFSPPPVTPFMDSSSTSWGIASA